MQENNLTKYLTKQRACRIAKWCDGYQVVINVKPPRKRKLGDYRKINHHQITVNSDLHPDLFFLTLTHEIAHMYAFAKYGKKIKPHGNEWKFCFGNLIRESIEDYTESIHEILLDFSKNPKANFYSYSPLVKYFHEKSNEKRIFLKELPYGNLFRLEGKIFKKEKKLKIKYICKEISSGRSYTVHGMAPVEVID